jgi:hypothetical protein
VAILSGLSRLVFDAGDLSYKNITELYTESIPFLAEGITLHRGVERLLPSMFVPTSNSGLQTSFGKNSPEVLISKEPTKIVEKLSVNSNRRRRILHCKP